MEREMNTELMQKCSEKLMEVARIQETIPYEALAKFLGVPHPRLQGRCGPFVSRRSSSPGAVGAPPGGGELPRAPPGFPILERF
jgi:hypothetical protein